MHDLLWWILQPDLHDGVGSLPAAVSHQVLTGTTPWPRQIRIVVYQSFFVGDGEGGGDDWGRILGRNPDKILKSFPSYYSQSPKQFCLEISISSNTATYNIKLRYNVKEKVWKPERKPYPLPYGLRDSLKKGTSSLRTLTIMSRNLDAIVRSWIQLLDRRKKEYPCEQCTVSIE